MTKESIPRVEVEIEDARGPGWLHVGGAVAATLYFLAFLVTDASPSKFIALSVGLAMIISPGVGRFRPRRGSLTIRPGNIGISAGPLSRRLRARHIVGASACRMGDRTALAFHMRGRHDTPLLLALKDEPAAMRVMTALGVGYDGKGTLRWQTMPSRGGITMSPTGIAIRTYDGAWIMRSLAYSEIARVLLQQETPKGAFLRIELFQGDPVQVLLHFSVIQRTAVEHLLAQLRSAVDRAQGRVEPRRDLATPHTLLRQDNEPFRVWLARVESTAVQMSQRPEGLGGYRSAYVISTEELWSIFESADADVYARAAAGRILARAEPDSVRTRIADVLETVGCDEARKRIRIGVELDAEQATQALEVLDETSSRRFMRP